LPLVLCSVALEASFLALDLGLLATDLPPGAPQRFTRELQRLIAASQPAARLRTQRAEELLVALIGPFLALILVAIALILVAVPLILVAVTLISHLLAPVRNTVPFLGPLRSLFQQRPQLLGASGLLRRRARLGVSVSRLSARQTQVSGLLIAALRRFGPAAVSGLQ
jgi:hypothetical protein